MVEITRGLYERMIASPTITAELATFNGRPAIFMQSPPPKTPGFPFILSAGSISDTPADTKTSEMRDVSRDILVVDEEVRGAERAERIAEALRSVFHRKVFSIPDAITIESEVIAGPLQADGPGTHGRLITVRILIEES